MAFVHRNGLLQLLCAAHNNAEHFRESGMVNSISESEPNRSQLTRKIEFVTFRTTQYTPYQPEIAQGRLESLLNYQTMVSEITGLDVANASLLDEGTAAAEAMTLCTRHNKRKKLYISDRIHPQSLEVIRTRATPLGLEVIVGPIDQCNLASREIAGILIQYPDTCGSVQDYADIAKQANKNGVS